jgi:hypothetical protein
VSIDDGSTGRCRAYGLDDPRVVAALAAETSAGGLPALRAGAQAAGVPTAYLVRLQRQLLADRLKGAPPCPPRSA